MGDGEKAAIEMEVLTSWTPGKPLVKALVDNKPFNFKAEPIPEGYRVWHRGCEFKVAVRTPRGAELAKLMPEKVAADTSNLLLCPMPGVIVSVLVEEGQECPRLMLRQGITSPSMKLLWNLRRNRGLSRGACFSRQA